MTSMSADTRSGAAVAGGPQPTPDDLAQLAYSTWDELFSMPRAQADAFQLLSRWP
jgi:hypothetical protein